MSEGESATFSCNVTGKGIKKVEWFKDKMILPSRLSRDGDSYISDLELTAVTVSQAGAFECRTTVVPTWYKGYKGKTGMLFVKGNWALLVIFRMIQMNIVIVQLHNVKSMKKNNILNCHCGDYYTRVYEINLFI